MSVSCLDALHVGHHRPRLLNPSEWLQITFPRSVPGHGRSLAALHGLSSEPTLAAFHLVSDACKQARHFPLVAFDACRRKAADSQEKRCPSLNVLRRAFGRAIARVRRLLGRNVAGRTARTSPADSCPIGRKAEPRHPPRKPHTRSQRGGGRS